MRRILRHAADWLLTLQGVMAGSLFVFFGAGLGIWLRPMPANELAIVLLLAFASLTVFGVATIVQHLDPPIVELRLRVRHLELQRDLDGASAEITRLRAAMAEVAQRGASPAGPESHPEVWVLPDPNEGDPQALQGGIR